MTVQHKLRPERVIGPLGAALTLDTLPPLSESRWTARRKAEVAAAVNGALLTADEACERYGLSLEELGSWQRAEERAGMPGLRVTKLQHYRELWERRGA